MSVEIEYSYTEFIKHEQKHKIHESEISLQHYVSLPIPWVKDSHPYYILFAAPALRKPGQPMQVGSTDRWWMMDAKNCDLVVYALCSVFPFSGFTAHNPLTIPVSTLSIQEIRQKQNSFEVLMNDLVPNFFKGLSAEKTTRKAAGELFASLVPNELIWEYRRLAPQFFEWLNK